MSDGQTWDGRGLPPVAAQRVHRAASGGPWTSLLSAPAAAGLAGTEFRPVGEVMGSIVQKMGWSGYRGCGAMAGFVRGSAEPVPAYEPYVQALYRGYDTALQRLSLEARALGADGVVGVAITVSGMDNGAHEFSALGTAVRATRSQRPATPFTTDLPAQDVAKLVDSGWTPAGIVYGISVAVRHDDMRTRNQSRWGAGNTEIDGHTRLVTHVRAESRNRFARHVERFRAHGAIVSRMEVDMWSVEPSDGHRDHVAEAAVFGNALIGHDRPAPARQRAPLTFLPLR